ncbi:hypothetical protein, partial [Sphingobium yanoikuyae]|uniref:hypothetical protein n=1 Tax=Sphingobium yanoikuyae TaxID=13690 RepID=UPI001BB074E7
IKHPYKIFTIALPHCTNRKSISLHQLSAMPSAKELASLYDASAITCFLTGGAANRLRYDRYGR